jgi:thiamine biosynthesis lipoprotein
MRRARPLLGTFVEIAVSGAEAGVMQAAIEDAFSSVATVHTLMSFHLETSDVGRLNTTAWARSVGVHRWTFRVLETAVDLYRRSMGIFDIAVAPALQNLGLLPPDKYPCARTNRSSSRTDPATTASIELLSDDRVRFHHPDLRVDLGGIAKGFAVDRAVEVLRARGVPHGIVNAGGDLAVFGSRPENIAIRDPRRASQILLGLDIWNEALASSGYRLDLLQPSRSLETSIIDPATRLPARAIVGTTVVAPSCMLADALTKTVMLMGTSAGHLLDHYRACALAVMADGSVQITDDLKHAVRLAA